MLIGIFPWKVSGGKIFWEIFEFCNQKEVCIIIWSRSKRKNLEAQKTYIFFSLSQKKDKVQRGKSYKMKKIKEIHMNFFGNGCGGGAFGGNNCCWIFILLLLCGNCGNGMNGCIDVCTLILLILLLSACGGSCGNTNC